MGVFAVWCPGVPLLGGIWGLWLLSHITTPQGNREKGGDKCICKTPANPPSRAGRRQGCLKIHLTRCLLPAIGARGDRFCLHLHQYDADIKMNSKAEWLQPMMVRVTVTRELEELEEVEGRGRQTRGGGPRGRGGGGGRQARGGQRRMRGGVC